MTVLRHQRSSGLRINADAGRIVSENEAIGTVAIAGACHLTAAISDNPKPRSTDAEIAVGNKRVSIYKHQRLTVLAIADIEIGGIRCRPKRRPFADFERNHVRLVAVWGTKVVGHVQMDDFDIASVVDLERHCRRKQVGVHHDGFAVAWRIKWCDVRPIFCLVVLIVAARVPCIGVAPQAASAFVGIEESVSAGLGWQGPQKRRSR